MAQSSGVGFVVEKRKKEREGKEEEERFYIDLMLAWS